MARAGRSAGEEAALGPRHPVQSTLRRRALRGFDFYGRAARKIVKPRPTHVEFSPPPRDSVEFADLSARINWYLPAHARQLPARLAGSGHPPLASPDQVPYLTPELVADASWSQGPQSGPALRVIHRLSPAEAFRALIAPARTRVVDANFAYGAEEGYFQLYDDVCGGSRVTSAESVQRLLSLRRDKSSAFVLATGPSAALVDPAKVTQTFRITCNSAVRNRELLKALRPDIIAFSDPVFHYGPSRYAQAFRDDLRWALDNTEALFLTSNLFVGPLLDHMPEFADRIVILDLCAGIDWTWPTLESPRARITGNVLTNLMLPAACAIADDITIAGCDGRDTSEKYFWKHNASTQYSDELMRTAFDAHKAFFRDRSYSDYYSQHCAELEDLLQTAEHSGKRFSSLTPSHVPALKSRGAPSF